MTQAGKAVGIPDPDFDRLDGTGKSGKRVDVIEWSGNLEIHVYPAGSLAGLALKLDKRNKNKPVMVIGYRFKDNPKEQLIRRAIIGIPFNENFTAYRDGSAASYDKVIISNHKLDGRLAVFKLDPEPAQLYPDSETEKAIAERAAQAKERQPAGGGPGPGSSDSGLIHDDDHSRPVSPADENGTIPSISW